VDAGGANGFPTGDVVTTGRGGVTTGGVVGPPRSFGSVTGALTGDTGAAGTGAGAAIFGGVAATGVKGFPTGDVVTAGPV